MPGTGFTTHPLESPSMTKLATAPPAIGEAEPPRRRSVGRIVGITLFSIVAGLTVIALVVAGLVVWWRRR